MYGVPARGELLEAEDVRGDAGLEIEHLSAQRRAQVSGKIELARHPDASTASGPGHVPVAGILHPP